MGSSLGRRCQVSCHQQWDTAVKALDQTDKSWLSALAVPWAPIEAEVVQRRGATQWLLWPDLPKPTSASCPACFLESCSIEQRIILSEHVGQICSHQV